MRQAKQTAGRGGNLPDPKTLTPEEAGRIAASLCNDLHEGVGGEGRVESFLLLLYGLAYSDEREDLLTAAEDASLTYVTRLHGFLGQLRAERLAALRGEKGGDGE